MIDDELMDRVESHMRRQRRPIGLLELRRVLGIPSGEAPALTKALKDDDRFFKVGSLWYVRKGDLKITLRFCPNCGSRTARYEGGFYSCPNCEIKFHFTWLV